MNRINKNTLINTYASPYRTHFAEGRHSDLKKEKAVALEIRRIELSPYLLMIVLLAMAVVLGFFQIVTYNRIATRGYDLKRLEVYRQELKSQSDIGNLYLAESKSMKSLISNPSIDNMRQPANVEFVQSTENIVALR